MARDSDRTAKVKQSVTIPTYFEKIIEPHLGDYYSVYPVDFMAKPVCKCPIHSEDTPSMRYYEETNTFYCFGCGAGGDVIELHRKFAEKENGSPISFDEAITFLYNYFIIGNEAKDTGGFKKRLVINKQENNNVDLIKYSRFANTLEAQLLIDSSIKDDEKKELWTLMDNIEILVSMNEINAIDGMSIIKQKVSNMFGGKT